MASKFFLSAHSLALFHRNLYKCVSAIQRLLCKGAKYLKVMLCKCTIKFKLSNFTTPLKALQVEKKYWIVYVVITSRVKL